MSFTRTETSVPMQVDGSELHSREELDKYECDKDDTILSAELKPFIESGAYEAPDKVAKIMALADRDNSGHQDFLRNEMMHNPDPKVARTGSTNSLNRRPPEPGPGFRPHRSWTVALEHYMTIYVESIIPQRKPIHTAGFSTDRTTYADGFPTKRKKSYCWPPAVCMVLISLVEVAIFCYDAAHGKTPTERPITKLFIYNPQRRQETWRFITYMLVHVDPFHLLSNVLVQLFLGVPLELVNHWWRVPLVYCAGGAAAALVTWLVDPAGWLAGASAGVYALSTAHIAHLIMNWSSVKTAIFQVIGFVLLVSKDIFSAVYSHQSDNIVYAAHYAGAVAGLLFGIGVLRNYETLRWEKYVWWAAFLLYYILMLAAVLANIFWKRDASLT